MHRRKLLTGGAALAAYAGLSGRAEAGPLPVPNIPVGACKFGNLMTRMPFWGGQGTLSAGNTVFSVWTGEADFDYVRPFFVNYTTTAYTITSMSVAASSSLNDQINPTNAAGTADNTLWAPVYTNNGGAPADVNFGTVGTSRPITVPPATQNTLSAVSASDFAAGVAVGDWTPCASLARTDSGTLPLVFMRAYAANGASISNANGLLAQSPAGGGAWDTYAAGRIVRAATKLTDAATTPGTIASATAGAYLTPFGLQFLSRKRGLSVMIVGDSLTQALGTTSLQNDPYQMAANALSSPAFPVTVTKCAYQGSSSLSFQENAASFFPAIDPDVVIMKAGSPNDTPAGAIYQPALARAFALCNYAVRRGCVPVLETAQPWGYTGTSEANRLAFNVAVRASGWLVNDQDVILTDGGTPANIQSAYNSGTYPKHYNDAGSAALTPPVIAILQKIMQQRPR